MTEEEKRELVESIEGLFWCKKVEEDAGWYKCSCGMWSTKMNFPHHLAKQLDPTSPADMGKIWEAFKEKVEFLEWWLNEQGEVITLWIDLMEMLTDTESRAQAMLEYFRSKEGK